MTILTEAQIELSRQRPQRTQLHLSIFQPRIIMKCRLNNASVTKGDRIIPYDGVSLGNYSSVESNFTMWVGSSDGINDLGKIRIRSATSSQFVVGENSNVQWQDDAWLTIFRYIELNPIYPRIIQSGDEDVTFFKDWDIPHSNQNSILGTFPCAGPDQAVFKGEQVYWSSTGTFNPLGDLLSFEWSFEGGTPTGSTARDPGFVTYNTPGHYVTRLMVSGSSGSNDSTYRAVSVYDKPGEGSSVPIEKWELTNLAGSRDEGGFTASFRVHENIPLDENSIVVLFTEDWYGSTKQSLGGNSPNNEKIFFVGRILRNTIRYNYQRSFVEFEVGSITEVMKQALGFSVSVESKLNPTTWYELLEMDCRRSIYHYLKWHTTALSLADFQFVGTDYKIQFFDADRTSMYDAVDNLMRNTLIGKFVSDRQGKMWAEVDAAAYSNPTGSFSSVMEITKRDWMNEPIFEERFSDQVSYLEMGGIAYSGVHTGTFSALLSAAPGSAPSFRGSVEMPEGLALLGQSQLNQLTGNLFANKNSRLPKIEMNDMAIGMRNLDIAPQNSVHMNILASDTIRGKAVDGIYIPAGMDWRYDSKNQILLPSISFESLVSGPAGETVVIPASVQDGGFDSGYSVPSIQIPPLPLLTIPPLFGGITNGLSTGSSCCDYFSDLGIGLGVYSCLYKRDLGTPTVVFPGQLFGWEYASNPAMYTAENGNMPLLNSGTVTYEFRLSGDWMVTAWDEPHLTNNKITVAINLYNSSGSLIDGAINYSVWTPGSTPTPDPGVVGGGVGSQGSFSEVAIISDSAYKKPYFLHATTASDTSPALYKVVFSNLRLEVIGTP